MKERKAGKPEIAAQKRAIKLAPAIGDWTTYKPLKVLVRKVKTGLYGFDRLSKEELDLILHIHYRFIEQLFRHFKIDLKMAVELFSVSVEQTTYINFLRSLTGPVVQIKLALPGWHDSVTMVLALPLANSIINHALGSQDLEPINRELTESEQTTLSSALTEYLPSYTAAFENVVPTPSLSIVGSPDVDIDASINPSSTFVTFSAEVALADNPPGKIIMGYLGNTLKSLAAKYKQKDSRKNLDFSRLSPALLSQILCSLQATLGQTQLTTREINLLEPGDVVSLNTTINSAIPLAIGNILKIMSQPGIRNSKLAVRLAGVKNEEKIELAPPVIETQQKEPEPVGAVKLPQPLKEKPKAAEKTKEEDIFDDEDLTEDFLDETEDDFSLDEEEEEI
ncbi:FliM/FliN family flagellar motor switch protein [Candidatus Margulisiibacteriota bacterium]